MQNSIEHYERLEHNALQLLVYEVIRNPIKEDLIDTALCDYIAASMRANLARKRINKHYRWWEKESAFFHQPEIELQACEGEDIMGVNFAAMVYAKDKIKAYRETNNL